MKKQIKLLLIFYSLLMCEYYCYGQLQVGREPEIPSAQTWNFIKYGNANANLHTGMVSVSVPFYTYTDKDFEIPISFDYASDGYKPNSLSGVLGQGWVLNVGGCITREVRGIPDDVWGYVKIPQDFIISTHNGDETISGGSPCKGFYYLSSENISEQPDVYMTFDARDNIVFYYEADNSAYDVEPDIFHFNFMGYSGSFYFGYNGQINVYHTNTYNGEFKIKFNVIHYNLHACNYENTFHFAHSIEITTGDGYKYIFGEPNPGPCECNTKDEGKFCFKGLDYKTQKNPTLAPFDNSPMPVVNTWKLTEIIAPNERTVQFNYGEDGKDLGFYKVVEYSPVSTSHQTSISISHPGFHSSCSLPEGAIPIIHIDSLRLYTGYLTSINVDNVPYIKFFYEAIKGESVRYVNINNNGSPLKIKQIDSVYLKLDSIDAQWKHCTFRYKQSIMQENSYAQMNKIPFLDSINISGEGSYVFEYYNRTDMPFPYMGSISLDHWGYYNGRNNSIYPVDLATIYDLDLYYQTETVKRQYQYLREPAPEYAIMGMLGWIKYPTGGYTLLHYEPHKYSTALRRVLAYDYVPTLINTLPEKTAGGLRIKKIENYTSNNTLADSTRYLYEKDGLSSGTLIHFPRYGIRYHANVISNYDTGYKIYNYNSLSDIWHYDKSHIEYSVITEKKSDNSKTIHYYPEYSNIQNNFLNGNLASAPSRICTGGTAFFAINNMYNNTYNYLWVKNILTPEQSMFYERNRLKRKDILNSNNTLLRSDKWANHYHIGSHSRKSHSVIGENISVKTIYDSYYTLSESKSSNYINANDSITENTFYTYNTQGQISSITTTDSKGDQKKIEYKHVSDLQNPSGIHSIMLQKNLKSYPLSEEIYVKPKGTLNFVLTEGKRYTYQPIAGSSYGTLIVVPEQIEFYNREAGFWETGIKHNSYDQYGNILESENRNGIKTVYLWGYGGKYLIAKISNCSLSQVKDISGLENIETTPIDISAYESALRAIPEAEVTSFYYEKLWRLTKIIDPSGRAIEYDFKNSQHGKIGEIFNELGIFTKYNYSTDEN